MEVKKEKQIQEIWDFDDESSSQQTLQTLDVQNL